ncbi:MAG TPA: DUF2851 family protein [Ktedonobacterales bacterium]
MIAKQATPREAEVAARWARGDWRGQWIETLTGQAWRVIFEGRRGGPAGPDFHDAVLAGPDGRQVCGDIELHLRATGWEAHGHHLDARYDGVILHLVCRPGTSQNATPLHSGGFTPLAVLPAPMCRPGHGWPCSPLAERRDRLAMRALLLWAGLMRLHEHAARFVVPPGMPLRLPPGWSPTSVALWLALAEGLGYGRDRALMRRIGESLLTAASLPDTPRGVDAQRASGLVTWRARWATEGPWPALRDTLLTESEPATAGRRLIAALTLPGRVSASRAGILVANVVLPCALSVPALANRAEAIYLTLPGLPANSLTREMARTLGLRRMPAGAAAQQGLQHLWAHWCQTKRCETCPCSCVRLAGKITPSLARSS